MSSNLDRYAKDLESLISLGEYCLFTMRYAYDKKSVKKEEVEADEARIRDLMKQGRLSASDDFNDTYQAFYSEAKELLRQLLPQRLADFVKMYERPKGRKAITVTTYSIEDSLQGVEFRRNGQLSASPQTGVGLLQQQLAILKSARGRFKSSLFEIRQLVQADLFDSEIDAAKELAKNKFARAAGAVAGVVLEKHLSQVLDNHGLTLTRKNPGINDRTEILKNNNVIDMPTWRFIQHLADIRNLCDHDKKQEPTQEQALDLVNG